MKGESMISYKKEAYSISIPEGELKEWEIRRIVANLPLSVREFIENNKEVYAEEINKAKEPQGLSGWIMIKKFKVEDWNSIQDVLEEIKLRYTNL